MLGRTGSTKTVYSTNLDYTDKSVCYSWDIRYHIVIDVPGTLGLGANRLHTGLSSIILVL